MTLDVDRAVRKGAVYEVNGVLRCTSHGDRLRDERGLLVAPCCGLEVRP